VNQHNKSKRILAVDPGSVRIGIALSDSTGTIANPLKVIRHVSRAVDAATIIGLAQEHEAVKIVVGQSIDEQGHPTVEGRRAARLAGAIRSQSDLIVELWDEGFSTVEAQQALLAMGSPRRKRQANLDDLAATIILQSFLNAHAKIENDIPPSKDNP
jgi:putative Holliday junction resolvase